MCRRVGSRRGANGVRVSIDKERAANMFAILDEQAQPLAEALLVTILKTHPQPTPLVVAAACRYVGLFVAKSLLTVPGASQDAVRDAFLLLDSITNVEELLAGNVEISDDLVEDLASGARSVGGRLPNLGHDPTVFDIDAWEEEKP